ncbi:MAG: SpoIIE family protein phosphatase [Treponema sp.]|jgi:sigma-B regulation protein RsbU (phosphoserine phosphatase)|nr:SpoIIE family protein phosphatase [Treponema sp.]
MDMFRNIKIGTKILCVVLTVSLLTLVVISIISYTQMLNLTKYSQDANIQLGITASEQSRIALLRQAEDYLQKIAVEQAMGINANLSQINAEVSAMAQFLESLYANPGGFTGKAIPHPRETTEGVPSAKGFLAPGVAGAPGITEELRRISSGEYLFSSILQNNPLLSNVYLGTKSGIFYRYSPHSSFDPSYDPRKRDWYNDAMSQPDKTIWIGPYIGGSDNYGILCITCARAFRDETGKIAGVLAADVTLETITERILAIKLGQSGYTFLLNNQGAYVAHPRYTEPGFNTNPMEEAEGFWLAELKAINAGNYGIYRVETDGEEFYDFAVGIAETGWALCARISIAEVIAPSVAIKQEIDTVTDNTQKFIRQGLASVLIRFIIIFAVSAILIVGFSFALSLTIIRPIEELAVNVRKIGKGDLERKIDVQGKDEVAELGNAFNMMVSDLKDYIHNLETVTAEKERINSELSVAASIQNDMLPCIFPKFSPHDQLALCAKMDPAKQVGGDFYDFFFLDPEESKVVFVIADVSGKGVPAALFMVIAKTLLKTHMTQGLDPAETLRRVNNLLYEDNTLSMFVTVLLCTLDLKTGAFSYANGGHNPPLISRSGGPYRFMELKKGIPPGMLEDSKYTLCEIFLHRGDKLYLYTDGVNEAMNINGEQWGNERFLAKANEVRDLNPDQFDEAIRQAIAGFVGGAEQSDDITTMAINYIG